MKRGTVLVFFVNVFNHIQLNCKKKKKKKKFFIIYIIIWLVGLFVHMLPTAKWDIHSFSYMPKWLASLMTPQARQLQISNSTPVPSEKKKKKKKVLSIFFKDEK